MEKGQHPKVGKPSELEQYADTLVKFNPREENGSLVDMNVDLAAKVVAIFRNNPFPAPE